VSLPPSIFQWGDILALEKKIRYIFFIVILNLLLSLGLAVSQGLRVQPMEINLSLAPGEEITKEVKVINETNKSFTVNVKKTDFDMSQNGELQFSEPNSLQNSICPWINISTEEISTPSQTTRRLDLRVLRPKANSCGDHWGFIFFETKGTIGTAQREGSNVGLKARFAVAVFQNDPTLQKTSGQITKLQTVYNAKKEAKQNSVTVKGSFKNESKKIINANLQYTIKNQTGKTIEKETEKDKLVLPEHTRTFSKKFSTSKWRPGRYIALFVVDYGGAKKVGGQSLFKIPENETSES